MSAWMEVAVDECLSREKALRLIRRFEALHHSLSPSRQSV
jgi:hypothetical protein